MTMYYTELDGAEPTVSIQVGGTRYTFTSESLTRLIEEKDSVKEEIGQVQRSKRNMAGDVKAFFEAVYTDNETDMVVSVDDVNELLVNIGADPFTKSWSATVLITATVTGIEAASKEAAKEILDDAFEVNLTIDGDIWVDDVDVQSVHAES